MKVEFLDRFSKDLIKVKSSTVSADVLATIQNVESCLDLTQIKNIKKLKGFKNAYRIRIKDFRIGVYIEDEIVEFARLVHRKDIYKVFP